MLEINSLRVLNDYLNQTIDALMRVPRVGQTPFGGVGLSHSPFGATTPFAAGIGIDPTQVGLAHSPYAAATMGAGFPGIAGQAFGQGYQYPGVIDPFLAQRGLSHTTGFGYGAWNPLAEIARQQQQLQALAAYRAWGVQV